VNTLQEIAQRVTACTDCPLSKTRTRTVPGAGPVNAELLLIGEAPGYYEDQQGLPFVGPSGRFLEQLLASIGLDRDQVYITNVVKCRPPGNRDPLPKEIDSCDKFLTRQINLINPKIVITLGRYSLARFLPNETIGRVHGKPRQVDGLTIFPMYHPAAALHQQRYRQTIIDDMKAVPHLLKDAPQDPEPPSPQDEQLSMF
jgi:DNA polymerase